MTREQIRQRQLELPEAARGYEHNADDELTQKMTDMVAKESGVPLQVGDLWINVTEGVHDEQQVRVGYLTRRGEIAMHIKFRRAGIKSEDVPYDEPEQHHA